MAPDIHARYQRAGDLLDDVLAARGRPSRARAARRRRRPTAAPTRSQDIQTRLQGARDAAAALLLALPQAAARAVRPLPVLRRSAVSRLESANRRVSQSSQMR